MSVTTFRRPVHLPAVRILTGRRAGAGGSLFVAAIAGVATAWLLPHGPTSAVGGLAVMAAGLALGLLGGAAVRTAWVAVPIWIVSVAALEVARFDLVSPTIDAIRLDTPYGVLAFVLGRGLHGLLLGLPLVFGARVTASMATSSGAGGRALRRRLVTGTSGVLTVALAVAVALPASTPPVIGADGRPVAGSIAELATVPVSGAELTVMIRAADPDAPVILYLAGGPGQSDLALARALVSGWEQEFVVAALDQRGNGKSYGAIDPVSAMTLERAVADVHAVTDYLRDRFAESRIYLLGESWGTILGVLAVQQRPDLYHAWIGSGQMVDVVETDQQVYRDLVAYAERTGNAGLLASLHEVGAPPYRDIPWANANLLAWYELLYRPYTPSPGYLARGEASGLDPFGVLGSEYDLVEKTNVLRGLIDTFALMYPQLYDLDLRRDAPRLEVPVWVLDGAAELEGRRALALDWFARLDAPSKHIVRFEDAAHAVAFEQAGEVQRLLTETIVPATYGGGGGDR